MNKIPLSSIEIPFKRVNYIIHLLYDNNEGDVTQKEIFLNIFFD